MLSTNTCEGARSALAVTFAVMFLITGESSFASGQNLTLNILEQFDAKISLISSDMGLVKTKLTKVEEKLTDLKWLEDTVLAVEKSVNRAFGEIQLQDESLRDLKLKNITKLERENILWRSNFRNINVSLAKLKRKVVVQTI